MLGKPIFFSFDQSHNCGAIDLKMDECVLGENYFSKCWDWILNWIWALTLSLLLKLPPGKLESLFVLCKFLCSEAAFYLYKSTILPYIEYC